MPLYTVRAIDENGRMTTVKDDVVNEQSMANLLKRRGLRLTRVVSVSKEARSANARWTVPRRVLADFTDRLQILYAAGVPLVEALAELHRGTRDPRMKSIIARLRFDIEAGEAISDSMRLFPRVFSPAYLAAVKAGEASGALEVVLKRLAHQIQWEQAIGASVKQAFIYPAVLMSAVLGLVIFLFTFLLPRLMKVFTQSGVELPGPTRIVVGASDILKQHGIALLCAAAACVIAFFVARRTARGSRFIDATFMKLPATGSLMRKVASARFTSALRTLHQAGTPMIQALELSRDAADNAAIADDVTRIIEDVEAGVPLSEALGKSTQLEPLVPRMVSVGEMSGSLTDALDHVVELYDREVQSATKRLVSILEPCIMLLSGVVVGFIVFATLLPIFRLFGAINK